MQIGIQTKNIICNDNVFEGFRVIKTAGFTCCDLSLNELLDNESIYNHKLNVFFKQSYDQLEEFFSPYKEASKAYKIKINQMHMPYPVYLPEAGENINNYLWDEMAPKCLKICSYLGCKYIVIHGIKLSAKSYSEGSYKSLEQVEWEKTEQFIEKLAPLAKQLDIVLCLENIYKKTGIKIIEGPCCDAVSISRYIDMINEKYNKEVLGFCFDTGHANLLGLDMESFIKTLGNRLKVLHIHDNDGVEDLHQIPYTFTRTRYNKSSTDWNGFICGLQKIGFSGVLSFETAPVLDSFPQEMKQDVLSFIADIGTFFSDRIEGIK